MKQTLLVITEQTNTDKYNPLPPYVLRTSSSSVPFRPCGGCDDELPLSLSGSLQLLLLSLSS